MKFYTGYFARIKKYSEMNLFPVSIARFNPKGTNFLRWLDVAPAEDILRDYKAGRIGETEYKTRYLAQLEHTDIHAGLQNIERRIPDGYDGVVFCCYEKTGSFCHRNILADYSKEHFGIEMQEVVL